MFGPEFEISTNVPADAIQGVSSQLVGWPRDLLLDCVGFATEESLRLPTDVAEIHLVPAVYGGGGSFAKILLGAALIAFALTNPFGWSTLAVTMIGSIGASLALAGVMQMFYKSPTLHKSDDPPASKYLGNVGNTTAIGTYRYVAYGRCKIYGHWLSLQVDARSIVQGRFPTTAPA
jgi:predicted phage tail protein